jgi:hypothetical protein
MKRLQIPGLLFFSFVVFSCATASFSKIDSSVEQGKYRDGAEELEKGKKKLYRSQDAVLSYLDRGIVAHYAESYEDSSDLLESGERAIEAAFTKSVSMTVGSYLINDTLLEYEGEDYEDIYINIFNALNYYHQGSMEDAMVEIRRMNNKIQFLASKYGVIISDLQKQALEKSSVVPPEDEVSEFTDSALARYMGVLFHRTAGNYDDARIDYEHLQVAFANAPHLYSFPVPSSLEAELEIPRGMARFNILAFSGLSPVKKEETLRVPVSLSNYIKIALPVLASRPSLVRSIELVFDGGERVSLEPLEDIDAVARETFKTKKNLIYLKTFIRALAKGITSSVLDAQSQETGGNTGLVLGIFSLANKVFAEVTEHADLRISRYFPGRVWAGGINLEPGSYSFTVNYRDEAGKVIASFRREDVDVKNDALNLVETICLK